MTTLQKLKECVELAQKLVDQLEKEQVSVQIYRYDDIFSYMPLAILGPSRRFLVMTDQELKNSNGEIKDEYTCILTYQEYLEGKTVEKALAEFVENRKKELNLV
jgi:hypothetical protein